MSKGFVLYGVFLLPPEGYCEFSKEMRNFIPINEKGKNLKNEGV